MGFMKLLTVAGQELALHDLKYLFIKTLLFIKSLTSSRRVIDYKQ